MRDVPTVMAIAPAVIRIADALQHQYLLTYALPDGARAVGGGKGKFDGVAFLRTLKK